MKRAIVFLVMLLTLQSSLVGQSRSKAVRPLKVAAAVAPEWPKGRMAVGKQEVRVTVTTDGYFGNVVVAESKAPKSIFSDVSEAAARLWKFYPAKSNAKQTLTFVFEALPNSDQTRRTIITFIPPYKVLVERPVDE